MKKIVLILLVIMMTATFAGCGSSAPVEPVEPTETVAPVEPERVYTDVSDTDIIYGIQLLEQICSYSEYEALDKIGEPSEVEGSIYYFDKDTIFNKPARMHINTADGEVKAVTWIHDLDKNDPDSKAVLEQMYADFVRVASEELDAGEPYEGDMGGSYSSFEGEYMGKTLLIDKYNDENYCELYIMMTEY